MKNNGIEDILISGNYKNTHKSSKIIIIFFIIIIFIFVVVAYWYFSTPKITTKQLFFNNLSNYDIKKITNFSIYNDLYEQLNNSNSEITSNINFSSTQTEDSSQKIDLSKFILNSTTKNDVKNLKSYTELGVTYSSNEIFNLKLLTNENKIGAYSEEILDKYIGVHNDNIEETFGIDYNEDTIKKLKNKQKIELSDEDINKFLQENVNKIMEITPEEKFSMQENIVIKKSNQSIPVTAYMLTLSQEDFNNVITSVLSNLRKNESFLEKIVLGQDFDINFKGEDKNLNSDIEINLENTEENTEENLEENEIIDNQTSQSNEIELDQDIGTQELELSENEEEQNEITKFNQKINEYTNIFDTKSIYSYFFDILFGYKIDMTVEELQKDIDNYLEDVKNFKGSGIVFTIYVSEEKIEKITINLPNENSLELEILKKSDEENNIKLTYLTKSLTSDIFSQQESITFSAQDELEKEISEENTGKTLNSGFSIEFDNFQNDTNGTIKIIYSFIENEQINKKITFNIKTSRTSSAKSYKNNAVLSFSTSDIEQQITIDNSINFSVAPSIEDLTEENCLFVDDISQEERETTINQINDRIDDILKNKKEELNIIDKNTDKSVVEQNLNNASNTITRDEAKNVLVDKISAMMQEAQENGQEFTLQNLKDLSIDGYEVSSTITENEAIIVIDVYTFSIDSDFNLNVTE